MLWSGTIRSRGSTIWAATSSWMRIPLASHAHSKHWEFYWRWTQMLKAEQLFDPPVSSWQAKISRAMPLSYQTSNHKPSTTGCPCWLTHWTFQLSSWTHTASMGTYATKSDSTRFTRTRNWGKWIWDWLNHSKPCSTLPNQLEWRIC